MVLWNNLLCVNASLLSFVVYLVLELILHNANHLEKQKSFSFWYIGEPLLDGYMTLVY